MRLSENGAHQSYTAYTQLVESAERGTLALDWIAQALQSEADEWARRGAAPDPSVIAMRDAIYSAPAAIHLALASGRDIARSIARSAAASGNGELAVKAVTPHWWKTDHNDPFRSCSGFIHTAFG